MRAAATPLHLADIAREAYVYFGAGAAVAWQMAEPGVGRGVVRHSRALDRPLDRLHGTMAYVYAVALGDAADRASIARHVDRAHAPVRGPGYSAFDRDLQLWVAATLYRGALDVHELFAGPVPPTDRDALYREAWAYGRTLQVRDGQWPATAEAFDAWWAQRAASLSVDDEVRAYVRAVLDGSGLPWWLRLLMPLQRLATAGLLPPSLRMQYGIDWTPAHARRWETFRRWAPRLHRATPAIIRHLPARYFLWRWRRGQAGREG